MSLKHSLIFLILYLVLLINQINAQSKLFFFGKWMGKLLGTPRVP